MPLPYPRRRSRLPYHLELLASLVARILYRVRAGGLEHFPREGGVLLLCNHISYIDVVVLQLACPRPIRFVAYHGLRRTPFLRWCFEVSGCIGISSQQPREGLRTAAAALQAGEVVCLCPEGHISRTGQLMQLQRGFEVIARHAGAPVVAVDFGYTDTPVAELSPDRVISHFDDLWAATSALLGAEAFGRT